jgi:flagellin
MGLRINTNTEAINTLRNLTLSQSMFDKSMQRLSSGKRVNGAADDAAGYAISQKLQAQSKGLDQAQANAQDGISLVQTASGGLQTTLDLLQRFRQLAVQSANDTNTSSDRSNLQSEADAIATEITQIASTTQFNTKGLLDGTLSQTGLTFQIGANAGQSMTVTIADMTASGLSVGSTSTGIDISSSQSAANTAITTLDTAINTVTTQAAKLGAVQNRLQAASSNLAIGSENMQAAYSAITNVNMAQESTALATAQILQQSGMAMLAQANQAPQSVLKLLG